MWVWAGRVGGWVGGASPSQPPTNQPTPAPRPCLQTFFANERTFLAWLHMAVTIGSVSTALLGFSGSSKADPGVSRPAGRAVCVCGGDELSCASKAHLGVRQLAGMAWTGREGGGRKACVSPVLDVLGMRGSRYRLAPH